MFSYFAVMKLHICSAKLVLLSKGKNTDKNLQITQYISDEDLYSFTNYGMDTATPTPGGGDCLQGVFNHLDSMTPIDSEFDESLAVPESLSVIEIDKYCKDETDVAGKT